MTAPLPKLETDEILEVLAKYSRNGGYTEFDLARIESKTKKLLSSSGGDPAECHMILGIIGLLMANREKCESGLRNSILLAPNDAIILMNGIVALASIGNLSESIALINIALERFPDNKQVIENALRQAQQTLQFSLGASVLARYDKLAVNDPTDQISYMRKQFVLMSNSVNNYGMTDAQLLKRLETAVNSVRAQGLEVQRTSTLTLHDGTFIYHFYLATDSQTCAETNFQIADALVDNFDDTGINLFSIMCRPVTDYAEMRTTHGTSV